ncbi:MAG: hypothetical protein KatS3mg053_1470 [Candidatus Roseilinea sp.]|nr:MAG: hypothetical protein KatS3mg053_1470 [Candidatus Roseilinea sp.]
MTLNLYLHIKLKSDATFGRGEGTPGEVDAEMQHDVLGLPYYGGRALKGVLAQECADLLHALDQQEGGRWWRAGKELFGTPGSTSAAAGVLTVGDAQLPEALRAAVAYAVGRGLSTSQVLRALTAVRKQTANDIATGAPQDETLRAMRVVLRETEFVAPLSFLAHPSDGCAGVVVCLRGRPAQARHGTQSGAR